MDTQITTLMDGRVTLHQSINGLRATTDSVLLASIVSTHKGDKILDMGCGNGAVALCLHERLQNIHVTGVDIQSHQIDLAARNAAENNAQDHCNFLYGDIRDKNIFPAQAFDHIVMNPPYYNDDERLESPDLSRETAFSGDGQHDLSDWIASALHWVKHKGSVNIIHRADALDTILKLTGNAFGAIEIWPVHSKPDGPAIRVLVKMIRNRKTPLTLHPAIILP